jgi:hypothetical protein
LFISIALGTAASWLIRRNIRKSDAEINALSIVTSSQIPPIGKLYAVPPHQRPDLPPQMIAALWYFKEIPPESMPGLAANLLDRGFDGKWLRRCAGEINPVRADIEGYANGLFMDAGVQAPFNEAQSQEVIGMFLAAEINDGRLNPFDGVRRIAALYDWDLLSQSALAPLINLAYEDEYESTKKESEIRQRILSTCSDLVSRR